MLLHLPDLLEPARLAHIRQRLETAEWGDGRITAGHQSARAKENLQLPENSPLASELGALVLEAVSRDSSFFAAALPRRIYPPLFNCYRGGGRFGNHIDNAVRYDRSQPNRAEPVRTDVSVTIFLSPPEDYDGGELLIEDTFGSQRVKLPAGHAVLYPASSLHQVTAVTRGQRLAAFFWVQSMVRDDGQRRLLFDLDLSIRQLTRDLPDHPSLLGLTGTYHNLLRRWAEV
jgi:PKHD-type hydroxylase